MTAAPPKAGPLRLYHQHTRGALSGFLMGLPLTLGYAAAVVFGPLSAEQRDFFIRIQIDLLGEPVYKGVQVSLAATFLVAVLILQRKGRFRAGYFGPLVVESMLYAAAAAALVWLATSTFHLKPPFAPPASGFAPLVSALGEAVNEETLFRWVLLEALFALFTRVATLGVLSSRLLSVILGAGLYATIGTFAIPMTSSDPVGLAARAFTLGIAGLFFGVLYFARGYPACAYTHVFHTTFWTGIAPYMRL